MQASDERSQKERGRVECEPTRREPSGKKGRLQKRLRVWSLKDEKNTADCQERLKDPKGDAGLCERLKNP